MAPACEAVVVPGREAALVDDLLVADVDRVEGDVPVAREFGDEVVYRPPEQVDVLVVLHDRVGSLQRRQELADQLHQRPVAPRGREARLPRVTALPPPRAAPLGVAREHGVEPRPSAEVVLAPVRHLLRNLVLVLGLDPVRARREEEARVVVAEGRRADLVLAGGTGQRALGVGVGPGTAAPVGVRELVDGGLGRRRAGGGGEEEQEGGRGRRGAGRVASRSHRGGLN
mmetsp:Transcript_24511/g.55934  ORF Transcript_24511/g.55934 Transcript_24511/m.55934 type:complete len:228 (-) Transcript_24511:507-1190(-)